LNNLLAGARIKSEAGGGHPPSAANRNLSKKLPKIIVIVGSTASGKSALAIKIAKHLSQHSTGAEIVSADSRQIYRGMDIGTAKPEIQRILGISNFAYSAEAASAAKAGQFLISKQTPNPKSQKLKNLITNPLIAEGISHYLIDIKNPDQEYTVARYKKDCIAAIRKILKKGKLPILVGGTGLYVKAVVENLEIPAVKPNPDLRRKLEQRIEKQGLETLCRELVERDPEAAQTVDAKNPRRVIRALEIAMMTKRPFSSQRKKGQALFDPLKIGIMPPRDEFRKRIEGRVDEMVNNGLVAEVKNLIKKYGTKPAAFDAIGYREIIDYLQAQTNVENFPRKSAILNEAIDVIKKNTLSFAKRQMTWFKKDPEIKWIKNDREALALIEEFLNPAIPLSTPPKKSF